MGFWQPRAMTMIGNIIIGSVLAAALLGGIALFWIARQDDSRAGRLIGLLAMAVATVLFISLTSGHHWL